MFSVLRRLAIESTGSIAGLAIVLLVVFIGVVGSAVDLGILMVQKSNLRNAVDAASLAGSRALVSGANPSQAAGAAAANQYLAYYGIQQDSQTSVSFSYPQSPTGLSNEMHVAVTRTVPTYFVKLLGTNTFTIGASATAEATPGMVDIALSLDLTGSMELSGTNDLANLQNAVVEFINDVNPDPATPAGPQIALARWAGVMCRWNGKYTPPPSQYNETTIDVTSSNEYVGPCVDDKTMITNLSMNKTALLNYATNSTSVPCSAPAGYGAMYCWGALSSWTYGAADLNGHDGTAQGLKTSTGTLTGQAARNQCCNPTYTGTKEPNSITVVDNTATGYYAWSTANGGRNAGSPTGNAHKVLVIMTDGNDELWPAQGMPSDAPDACSVNSAVTPISSFSVTSEQNAASKLGCWDNLTIQLANTLKLGLSGIAGNPDDVEIYTVGFFCTPYYDGWTNGGHQNWCTSKMADPARNGGSHPCPGAWDVNEASVTDYFLYKISSSSPGTCDHYFPISKQEQLPQYFKQIAGAIARGKLVS